jgi:hypothetical protein
MIITCPKCGEEITLQDYWIDEVVLIICEPDEHRIQTKKHDQRNKGFNLHEIEDDELETLSDEMDRIEEKNSENLHFVADF